jgi:hypothetical protein
LPQAILTADSFRPTEPTDNARFDAGVIVWWDTKRALLQKDAADAGALSLKTR